MRRDTSVAEQGGRRSGRLVVLPWEPSTRCSATGRCSSTGGAAAMASAGSRAYRTLRTTCFQGLPGRRREILSGTWKPGKCVHFTLCERGKVRPIDAPHITDRQVHKTLCSEVLIPLYNPSMIFDNGASQRNKGLHWHFQRLKEHLYWHYRRYGRTGAMGLVDLKAFFPGAPRQALYQRHQLLIPRPGPSAEWRILWWITPPALHRAGGCRWALSHPSRRWWPSQAPWIIG